MVDIDKIERAAEAATPGPWRATEKTVTAPETDDRLPLDVRIYGGNKHDDTVESLAADLTLYAALEALK